MSIFNITKAHLIRFPSGKYGFVGKVPASLMFEYESEEDLRIALHSGPGIARRIAERDGRIFRRRVWDTEEAAMNAADNCL